MDLSVEYWNFELTLLYTGYITQAFITRRTKELDRDVIEDELFHDEMIDN